MLRLCGVMVFVWYPVSVSVSVFFVERLICRIYKLAHFCAIEMVSIREGFVPFYEKII